MWYYDTVYLNAVNLYVPVVHLSLCGACAAFPALASPLWGGGEA